MNPAIFISKKSILIDEPLQIQVSGLIPNKQHNLKATMRDNFGNDWVSQAQFESDSQGVLDLTKATPLAGSYKEADVNGLFWSMEHVPNSGTKHRTPLKPLETILTLEKDGEELAHSSITRHLVAPEVERQSIREEGLVGTLFFHPKKAILPTVIVLGGSEGGLQEGSAALLASYGFNTLALAYFGVEYLPSELAHIPIDYIEKAIQWLTEHPNVDDRIGIMGTSKGGELALLCASMFPEIKAVVGYVPSSVVFSGIGSEMDKSSWTYKGKELPFARGQLPIEVLGKLQQNFERDEPICYRDWYLHTSKGKPEAKIQVENIAGPVLLISGGDDQLWPADVFSEQIIDRLRENKHPYLFEHINYDRAGHAFAVPGYPTTQSVEVPFFEDRKLLLGGSPKENATAQRDAWQRVKVFFKEQLNNK